MKFRRDTGAESDTTREEVREMAEALSLYRSAMRHVPVSPNPALAGPCA